MTPQQRNACFQRLGVTQRDIDEIRSAPSLEVGKERLGALQKRVKAQYRKAVLQLHPDRNPDPQAAEALKVLNEFHGWFAKLDLKPQPRRQQPAVPTAPMAWSSWNTSTATTSTGFGGGRTTVTYIVNGQVVVVVQN